MLSSLNKLYLYGLKKTKKKTEALYRPGFPARVGVKAYMGGISQYVKTLKNMGFLHTLLWVFLTIYLVVALIKIIMYFKQLKASYIMSCDS